MKYMNKAEKENCTAIIHTASILAAGVGAGLAQIPWSDNVVLTPIQVTMTVALGKVFGFDLGKGVVRGKAGSILAGSVGRTIVKILVGRFPGVGNAINATIAAALTESIGWALAREFAKARAERMAYMRIE